MKKLFVALVAILSGTALAAAAAHLKSTDVKADEATYVKPFGEGGPEFGFVRGKFGDKNPATMFIKVKAGFDSGWHIHDEDYEGVVLKGTFGEQQQGGQENALPAATYFSQTGKQNHRNWCSKDGDCLVMVHFEHGANSKPMTADGKPVKMDKAADKGGDKGAEKKM